MPLANPAKESEKAGGGKVLAIVETALDVTVPVEPPPETFTLTDLVPVVVEVSVKGINTGTLRAIEVVLVQVTIREAVAYVQLNPLVPAPPETKVMPVGKVLLSVVVPVDAVVPVSVSVAV